MLNMEETRARERGAGMPWRRLERAIRDSVEKGTPNPYFSRRHMLRKVVLRNTTHMRAPEVRAHWAFILRLQGRRDRLVFKSPSSEHSKWWESDAAEWGDSSDGAEGLGGQGEAGGSNEGRVDEEDEDVESMDSEDDPDVGLVEPEGEKDDVKIASQANRLVATDIEGPSQEVSDIVLNSGTQGAGIAHDQVEERAAIEDIQGVWNKTEDFEASTHPEMFELGNVRRACVTPMKRTSDGLPANRPMKKITADPSGEDEAEVESLLFERRPFATSVIEVIDLTVDGDES